MRLLHARSTMDPGSDEIVLAAGQKTSLDWTGAGQDSTGQGHGEGEEETSTRGMTTQTDGNR